MKKVLLFITVLTLFFPINIMANSADRKVITILSTADLHGRIFPYNYLRGTEAIGTGAASASYIINREREVSPNLILLDTGDTIQGEIMHIFKDDYIHPMVKVLNIMETDVWTLGNHEFNYGLDILNSAMDNFSGDVVVANIYTYDGDRWLKPYKIFDIDGIKVAIVGMITPNVPIWEAANPHHFEGLIFTDPLEEAKKVINELEGKADIIVGNFHIGLDTQLTETDGVSVIAENVQGFDVIFAAHSHALFDDVKINGTRVIAPGHRGSHVARADIELKYINNEWVVADTSTRNIPTKNANLDNNVIIKELEYTHIKSLEEVNRVVGYATDNFVNGVDYITGSNYSVTTIPRALLEETALINFINEVQMFYADADISSTALFSFNSNIFKGDFKNRDIFNIYRFDNTLFGVYITGENLIDYLEWSVSYYNTFRPGDVTISFNPNIRSFYYDIFSGINYKIDISKEPGQRIVNPTINGSPIDLDKNYRLAVNNYRLGTLISNGWVTLEDVYYDSSLAYSTGGQIRDLIAQYIIYELDGVLEPQINNNWSIIGADIDPFIQDKVFDLIRNGIIDIPRSSDKRTINAASINYYDLLEQGFIFEAGNNEKLSEEDVRLFDTNDAEEEGRQGKTNEDIGKLEVYIVQNGDTLWAISNRFNTTYLFLAEYNQISNPNLIFPGQEIKIPQN